jgi:hypothetical protein
MTGARLLIVLALATPPWMTTRECVGQSAWRCTWVRLCLSVAQAGRARLSSKAAALELMTTHPTVMDAVLSSLGQPIRRLTELTGDSV